ncbi:hypothetical protein MMC11_005078 [Xylographa trunciseda]|nr:hypothetical protein [Xylographa trunciseda]
MATAPNMPPGSVIGTVPAPPGITPNFVNPPRDSSPLILTIIFLTLSLIFVSMRLFTRIVLLRGFGWDDGTLSTSLDLETVLIIVQQHA